MTLPAEEVTARLTLLALPGLGAATALGLLREHGGGRAALARLRARDARFALAMRSPAVTERVERTVRTAEREDVSLLWFDDVRYPRRVHERLADHAPPLLFARGDLALLDATCAGVVGCRDATNYGLEIALQVGAALGRAGGCVVSGLARGIDAAAHRGALEAGGATIAVLGCGIDVHYPRENGPLQDRIALAGLVLTEFFPGAPPLKHHFPHRNRIIAALSKAVIVVEATERSGAVNTAEHALNQSIDVFAVPNALDLPNMQGNLALLRDGAHVYTGARDLLEFVGLVGVGEVVRPPREREAPPADPLHCRVWNQLARDACHVDAIAVGAGVDANQVLVTLLELELAGRVKQLPGGRYQRTRAGV